MNIQQFLEEETQNITQYAYFVEHQSEEELSGVIREHNSRIINKVLEEVKRDVEKHYEYDTSIYDGTPFRVENETSRVLDDILDQLKLK